MFVLSLHQDIIARLKATARVLDKSIDGKNSVLSEPITTGVSRPFMLRASPRGPL